MTQKSTQKGTQKGTKNLSKMSVNVKTTKTDTTRALYERAIAENAVAQWIPYGNTPKVDDAVKMTKTALKTYRTNVEKRHGKMSAKPSSKRVIDGTPVEVYTRIAPDGFTWIECHVIDGQKHNIIAVKMSANTVVFYRGH